MKTILRSNFHQDEKNSGLEQWEQDVLEQMGALFKSSAFESKRIPDFFGIKASSISNKGYART